MFLMNTIRIHFGSSFSRMPSMLASIILVTLGLAPLQILNYRHNTMVSQGAHSQLQRHLASFNAEPRDDGFVKHFVAAQRVATARRIRLAGDAAPTLALVKEEVLPIAQQAMSYWGAAVRASSDPDTTLRTLVKLTLGRTAAATRARESLDNAGALAPLPFHDVPVPVIALPGPDAFAAGGSTGGATCRGGSSGGLRPPG